MNLDHMTFEQGAIVVISTLGTVVALLFWLYVNSLKDRITRTEAALTTIQQRFDDLQTEHQEASTELAEKKAELQAVKDKFRELRSVLEGCSVDYCPLRPRSQHPSLT
jgi:type II secretory pathway pseudopilin PulG